MKLVAVVSMVVDHVGMIFYPEHTAFRLAGRLALPLFAYLVAAGIQRTTDRQAYLLRLFTLFICSQFVYGLFTGTKLNVFLPLLVGALVTNKALQKSWWWVAAITIAYAGLVQQQDVSYGVTGPLLVVGFAAAGTHLVAGTVLAAGIFFAHGALADSMFSQMALFAVPLVPLVVHFVHWRSPSKWRWAYWAYPAHLAVFYLVAWHLGITEHFRR